MYFVSLLLQKRYVSPDAATLIEQNFLLVSFFFVDMGLCCYYNFTCTNVHMAISTYNR